MMGAMGVGGWWAKGFGTARLSRMSTPLRKAGAGPSASQRGFLPVSTPLDRLSYPPSSRPLRSHRSYNFEDGASANGNAFMNSIQGYAAIRPVMPAAG